MESVPVPPLASQHLSPTIGAEVPGLPTRSYMHSRAPEEP